MLKPQGILLPLPGASIAMAKHRPD